MITIVFAVSTKFYIQNIFEIQGRFHQQRPAAEGKTRKNQVD